ncbi:Prostate-associated microseminoprotein PC3-secreted microprotein [Triplophysa tibetana]|uniref:Prostate-associated microseminoprotein n=1 Tax=Triplophysa tibetana TaxID=1572043 RepID=A0A5A9PQB1_9TELE|nr:Prostate-associated microseminoprotein PC3-secreted microprotein [Triplophysa tibetana]
MDSMMRHNTMIIFIGFMMWTACLAAPMQCHFNSQALCEYEGKQYSMGESWMEQGCIQCTCLHPVGVGCCETVHQPVDFPAWCEVRVETLTCQVTLVMTSDPRLLCIPGENNIDPRHGAINMNLAG